MSDPIYQPAPDRLALDRAQLAQIGLDLGPALLVPLLGASLEAATIVRRLIEAVRPAAIALDLPRSAAPQLLRAAARLPLLSVVTLSLAPPYHIIIEPTDPRVEAIRRAQELQIPLHIVGPDPDDASPSAAPLPDPVAAEAVGAIPYLQALLAATSAQGDPPSPADHHLALELARLAYRPLGAPATQPLLVLCAPRAAAHLPHLLRAHLRAAAPPPTALHPRPRLSVELHHLSESASRSVLAELPFFAAAYERARAPQPSAPPSPPQPKLLHLTRPQPPQTPPQPPKTPDAQAGDPHDCRPQAAGSQPLLIPPQPPKTPDAQAGDRPQAAHSQPLLIPPQPPKTPDAQAAASRGGGGDGTPAEGDPHDCRPQAAHSLPAHRPLAGSSAAQAAEDGIMGGEPRQRGTHRRPHPGPPQPPQPHPSQLSARIALLQALCRHAHQSYRRAVDQPLRPGVIAGLLRYACRYALTERRLAPDLYQLLIAARGFVDDTYAAQLWEHATVYPWQSASPGLPVLDLALSDLRANLRHLRFRPRRLGRRLRALAPPPRESRPGEWSERFDDGVCSYPPEDLLIEGTGERLRSRAERQLADERQHSRPFTAAIEQGIDLRETLRRWHEGVLYVRVERAVRGRAGDVVLIFEDEPLELDPPKYPCHLTWQGESAAEGDLATYATDPMEQLIGPGIGRARYGGLLLHRPAGTMHNIWRAPDPDGLARTKAEHLLLAALEHSRERAIIYIAEAPPRRRLQHHAQRMDKRILYTPLAQLTPLLRRRLRVFHVLSDPALREIAPRYIR